ncbi:hypothetical protein K5V21_18695 [Clostridium sardiniense]|uniref:Uncharacterized protein n=1 Tax=Clostridium sardiniense TaxID=29369 RepID=A0ABS7L2Z8_CLOSR|nr:DUF6809 family protein [Clostridium sardiniense]MBY0757446.1 hypothetical protein [Clostridium sardiniense]MDQ0462191.1 hypothetical protein [Clostridium sardiniense]
MNLDKLHEIVKDIINREADIEFEYDFEYMTEEEDGEYRKCVNTIRKLQSELESKLDEKDKKKLIALIDALYLQETLESMYYFERGVRKGLTNLCYLNKYFNLF